MKKKATKEQAQKILSTVIMCMNCVNTFAAPIAVFADLNKQTAQQTTKNNTEPTTLAYNYELIPNALSFVDNMIFAKAEAAFTETVGAGGTTSSVSNEVVENGTQNINNGGTATSNTLNTSGIQKVASGGTALGTIVNSGGTLGVASGGVAQGAVINTGGSILNGLSTKISGTILNGGSVSLSMGGKAYDTIINSGGTLALDFFEGSSFNTVVNSGGVEDVRSGGTANSTIIKDGGIQNAGVAGKASSNGKAISAQISSGGIQNVYGLASGTIISAGGTQNINSGGTALGGTIGGVQNIYTGANISGTWSLVSGGEQNLHSGTKILVSAIIDGGTQNVLDGARAGSSAATGVPTIKIINGGIQNIESGGIASNIELTGGTLVVSGSTSTYVGGTQNVKAGAMAVSVTSIGSGGVQNIYNKITVSNITNDFRLNTNANTVDKQGQQNIYSGGAGHAAYVQSGGVQTVYDGGTGTAQMVSSGGTQRISSGGTGMIITDIAKAFDGGVQIVDGGVGIVDAWGKGSQIIYAGTGIFSKYMESGASQMVSGGTGTTREIHNGAVQTVFNGVASAGYTDKFGIYGISSGGQQVVSGGTGIAEIITSKGLQTVSGGTGIVLNLTGDSADTPQESGGTQAIVGGIGSAGKIQSGGIQTVATGAIGYADNIGYKGTQKISGGTGYVVNVEGTGALNHGNAQQIIFDGLGVVDHLFNGNARQVISGGTGYIKFLGPERDGFTGGEQNVSGGTGIVDVVHGGEQKIYAGATSGFAGMVSGIFSYQYVSGAIGKVGIIANSGQQVIRGGTGYAGYIGDDGIQYGGINSGGTQLISAGTGIAYVYSGGLQLISAGSGVAHVYNNGLQRVLTGANATDSVIYTAGVQDVQAGANAAKATIMGGTQTLSGTATDNKLYSGQQNILATGVANNTAVYNGTQSILGAAVDTTVSGGVQALEAGGTATRTNLQGGMLAFNDNTATVEEFSMSAGEVRLGGAAADYSFTGDTTLSGGLINMIALADGTETKTAETLNIANLKGNGVLFRMDADLEAGTAKDQINIANSEVGQHKVQINNTAASISNQDFKIKLITDTANNATFVGTAYNNGGLFMLTPTIVKGSVLGENDNEWYITQISKTTTGDALVLLNAADNAYALWRNTNDSMRSRLGELRASQDKHSRGIWARYFSGAFEGAGYDGKYNMYQLGFDQAVNAKSTYGIAVDHSEGNSTYANGSGKDELTAFSLYGVWTANDDSYTNLTLRGGTIKSDLKSYGINPDSVDYRTDSYSVSIEYGKRFSLHRGYFIEPQAQFTLGHISGVDYTTLRSAHGHIDSMNSAIGRIGFALGQKSTNGDNWYVKANVLHEFGGARHLELSSSIGGSHDVITKDSNYGDTWFEIGIGGNLALGKNTVLYGDVERSLGGNINKKWQINAGVRCAF